MYKIKRFAKLAYQKPIEPDMKEIREKVANRHKITGRLAKLYESYDLKLYI